MSLLDVIGTATFVIAEAGVNHNGSVARALAMVDAAAEAGADAVKFQTFRAAELASAHAVKAAYQAQATGTDESQLDMLRRLELDFDAHRELFSHAKRLGICCLSSPFDLHSLQFLVTGMDVPAIKLGSGEVTNGPLLVSAARTGKPIILSTGMSTLDEVREALGALAFGYLGSQENSGPLAFPEALESVLGKTALKDGVALLHCTSQYPAPLEDTNLLAMAGLSDAFGLTVGFSDHTRGNSAALAAVALGARIIEKHFTLDRRLPGPDHGASLEPDELKHLVNGIREVDAALGSPVKKPAPSELSTREVARRSLTAAQAIRKGETFTAANLAIKRPGGGISPMRYWEWLGRIAKRDFAPDETIQEE